jgi:hypothetical protein
VADLSIFEGDNSKVDYTLTYSANWSNAAKRGLPVLQADVSRVYWYAKTLKTDTSAWLTLTDASASQIAWLDATAGKIRVFVGSATTEGHAGDAQYYECRIKFSDGTYATVDSGTLNVLQSLVDQP